MKINILNSENLPAIICYKCRPGNACTEHIKVDPRIQKIYSSEIMDKVPECPWCENEQTN